MKWITHQSVALMAAFSAGFPLAGIAAAEFGLGEKEEGDV